MNKLLPKTTLFLLFLITAIAVLWLPTYADEPTAVHLASFDVTPLSNAVRINWETATELGTAGFRIKRAVSGGTEGFLTYVGDNGFIPAIGTGISGSIYTVTDNQVQNGSVYTYILIELENSGAETELARATVTVSTQPTNTPVAISGGSGSSSNATATPRATTTSSTNATATPATVSKTIAPTNTPPSFVTVTPRSVQTTAVPTQSISPNNTNSTNNTAQREETANSTITGVAEVYAQEAPVEETDPVEIAAQPVVALSDEMQEGYPGVTATAVTNSEETYPNDTAISESSSDAPSPTPVPVIGSTQGYTEPNTPTDTSNSGTTASSNNSRIFLWLGFIVALLIFATGLIGAIILFTRKSQ